MADPQPPGNPQTPVTSPAPAAPQNGGGQQSPAPPPAAAPVPAPQQTPVEPQLPVANYIFVPTPLTLDDLQKTLTSIESTDDVNTVNELYPTNAWVKHVYAAVHTDPKRKISANGYAILYGAPEDLGGTVQAVAVTGADDEHMALNASIAVGRGNELIGYEDFDGPTRVVIFRNTTDTVAAIGAPNSLSWNTSNHPERVEWTLKLVALVGQNRAKLDLGNPEGFIAGFSKLSNPMQTKFWAEMLVAIAQFESSWEPTDVYHEKSGNNSVGLLQLSKIDQKTKPYNLTPLIDSEESLKNAELNLTWGVTIFSYWLATDKVVAAGSAYPNVRGSARYWSTMRAGHKVELIKALTKKNAGL